MRPADIARLGMIRSFQISAVFPHLSVLENVALALQRRQGTSFQFWRSGIHLETLHDRAGNLIDAVNPTHISIMPPSSCPMAASGRWKSPPRWRLTWS